MPSTPRSQSWFRCIGLGVMKSTVNRTPDVWVTYASGNATFQHEDADYDGVIDQSFDLATQEPRDVNGDGTPPSLERFETLACRGFSAFWKR